MISKVLKFICLLETNLQKMLHKIYLFFWKNISPSPEPLLLGQNHMKFILKKLMAAIFEL